MNLSDVPLSAAVQLGSFDYVKVASNAYMQSSQVVCPEGSVVGYAYVKCLQCPEEAPYDSESSTCVCSDSSKMYDVKTNSCTSGGGSCTAGCVASSVEVNGTSYKVFDCLSNACAPGSSKNSETGVCECNAEGYDYIDLKEYGLSDKTFYVCAKNYVSGDIVKNFTSTGSLQTFTAPQNGTYKLEVWGAQGGKSTSASYKGYGGYGAYSYGSISLAKDDVLSIVVGGAGTNAQCGSKNNGGYNGGGAGNNGVDELNACYGGGGGASHIAIYNSSYTTLNSYSSTSIATDYVLLVAGGGAGGGYNTINKYDMTGGQGGGYIGGTGYGGNSDRGTGGSQTSAGRTSQLATDAGFGKGGYGYYGPGGGGGWYGGGGSGYSQQSAGGGSGFVNTTKLISTTYGMSCYTGTINAYENTKCITGTYTTSPYTSVITSEAVGVSEVATANYAKSGSGHARITYSTAGDFSTDYTGDGSGTVYTTDCVDGSAYGVNYAQNCLVCANGYKFDKTYKNGTGDCILQCGEHSSIDSDDPLTCNCESGWSYAGGKASYSTIGDACDQNCVTGMVWSDSQKKCIYTAEYCGGTVDNNNGWICNFTYSGNIAEFTAPHSGIYKLEVWGGQGGTATAEDSNYTVVGGMGGYSQGNMSLTSGQVIYVTVGGAGASSISDNSSVGGYNGGGASGAGSDATYGKSGGGGGGATHMATATGLLSTLSSNTGAVKIVAGGGAGAGASCHTTHENYYYIGGTAGVGGGTSGIKGTDGKGTYDVTYNSKAYGGEAGTQSNPGLGGKVTNATNSHSNRSYTLYPGGGGGGGAGLYGGGGGGGGGRNGYGNGTSGSDGSFGIGGAGGASGSKALGLHTAVSSGAGGGGGSGYVGGVTDGVTIAGDQSFTDPDGTTVTGHSGNGYARITLMSVD